MKKVMLSAVVLTAFTPSAIAEIEPYIGVGVGTVKVDMGGSLASTYPKVGVFRGGATFNQWIGVEGELSMGIASDDSFETRSTSYDYITDVDFKAGGAVFAVGHLPIGDNFSFFGRLGGFLQQTDYKQSIVDNSANQTIASRELEETEHGFAYGLGIDFYIPDSTIGFRLDYTRYDVQAVQDEFDGEFYEARNDATADALTGSLMFRF
ncbi:porin family protein [Hirschia litorea]|uniref:Porin family protein n=1 Tax=Hirschia litorea TaxID=1199156 RepID=A0ABW2IIP8_9PROT